MSVAIVLLLSQPNSLLIYSNCEIGLQLMNIDQQTVANQCMLVVWNRVQIGIMPPGGRTFGSAPNF